MKLRQARKIFNNCIRTFRGKEAYTIGQMAAASKKLFRSGILVSYRSVK